MSPSELWNHNCTVGRPDCDCRLVYEAKVAKEMAPAKNPVKPVDEVNQPGHYTSHPSGVECITITEHMNFNLGNAVKYIWRASLKGKQQQDLEKAIWYLQRELKRLYP